MLNTAPQIQYSAILDFIYPVGSYFITESANYDTVEKVQSHFGGTWTQVTERFLYGSTSAGTEGGEATHTLTIDEIPSHNHYLQDFNMVTTAYTGTTGWPVSSSGSAYVNGGIILSTYSGVNGGSQAHNNMPPYRTVYMYRRTA